MRAAVDTMGKRAIFPPSLFRRFFIVLRVATILWHIVNIGLFGRRLEFRLRLNFGLDFEPDFRLDFRLNFGRWTELWTLD